MKFREFQALIGQIYLRKDGERGIAGTFQWFVEEVGELARALRKQNQAGLQEEIADCLAWLVSLANLTGVDVETAAEKYTKGCPKCGRPECGCGDARGLAHTGGT